MRKLLFPLFLIIILSSCSKKKVTIKDDRIIDFSNLKIEKSIDLTNKFNFKPIILETNNDCLIGQINKIRYINNRIYILDFMKTKSIFVFNNKGKFLFKISPYGKSKKECLSLIDFDIYKNNIILLSCYDSKLLFFDLNGKYKKTLKLEKYANKNLAFLSDSLFITTEQVKGCNIVDFWNLNGKKIKTFKTKYLPKNFSHQPKNPLTKHNDELYVNFGFNDTLCKITKEKILPFKIFNFGTKHFPLKKLKTTKKLFDTYYNSDKYSLIYDYSLTDNYIITDITNGKHTSSVIYDRNTHNSRAIERFNFFEYSISCITGNLENGFISFIAPNHIAYMNNKKHGTLFPNVKAEDNPVIVLVTEKNKTLNTDNKEE